jgi:muramidase (phage lysozyme)
MVRIWVALVLVVLAGGVRAELQSLFPRGEGADTVSRASLFVSPEDNIGFFAPLPQRAIPTSPAERITLAPMVGGTGTEPLDRLLTLIARAEAGSAGYDAVQYGATVRPAALPTHMTLGEIYQWIDDTPGQPHAIGRYQFIPSTLRRVAQVRGFGPDTQFTPGVQDALALVLLNDAGFERFQAGVLGRQRFMYNLARIWAGLPLPNGNSYYQGYAGNKATMSWATFEGGMTQIWPANG